MLTTLMDTVYISGSVPCDDLDAPLCDALDICPLPADTNPEKLPGIVNLVVFALTCEQDLFRLEHWLVSSRRYALVLVVAESAKDLLIAGLEAGADDYLIRPEENLPLAMLVLQRAVSRKQALQQSQDTYQELEQLNLELMTSLDLLQQDQQAGRYVQQKMLPKSPWLSDPWRFEHLICPSLYLSGDFVDYFPAGEGQVLFYLADVSGHGASSAFITLLLRVYIRRFVKQALRRGESVDPVLLLRSLNAELLETNLGKHLTIFLGILHTGSGRLRYCNGAHFPYPVLTDDRGQARYIEGKGMPVGLFADADYQEFELLLHPRYHLTLFSDGVFEVFNESSLADKEQRLLEIAARYAGQHDAMVAHFTGLGMNHAPDDVSLLAVSGC